MQTALLWLGVFTLTWLEALILTRGGKADRSSTTCATNRRSIHAANWDAAFELIAAVGMYLIVKESAWLLIPIVTGGWLGTYTELERRRKRWRSRVKRKKQP